MNKELICDVCKENEAVGVASSPFGAISSAYCGECLRAKREEYWILVGGLAGCRSMDDVAEWTKPYIKATLEAEGKTEEELFQDVEAAWQEYTEEMRKYG